MDCDTCSFECSQMNIDKLLRARSRVLAAKLFWFLEMFWFISNYKGWWSIESILPFNVTLPPFVGDFFARVRVLAKKLNLIYFDF